MFYSIFKVLFSVAVLVPFLVIISFCFQSIKCTQPNDSLQQSLQTAAKVLSEIKQEFIGLIGGKDEW